MSTLDLLPSKDDIADALRQLTGRSNPPGHLLAGLGIFAVGILTGAALAVLFAPKPGAELRQEIGARVGGFRDKIAKTAEGAAYSRKPA
jgi:YtxH-like protein